MAKPDPYRPRRHPNQGLTRDDAAQADVTADMRRRGWWLTRSFGAMFAVFAAGAGFALAGAPAALTVAAPLFLAAFAVGLWHVIPRRPPDCSACGGRMLPDYRPSGGRSRRFAVCRACGRFIDTHWKSR